MAYLIQQALNAAQVSAFYALLSLGYVLVHGVTNRVNLAFGALFMWGGTLGALAALALSDALFLDAGEALLLGLPLVAAAYLATALVFSKGVVMPLAHRPGLAMLVATIGVAIVLEEVARIAASSRDLWLSPILSAPLLDWQVAGTPFRLSGMQGVVLVMAAALLAATLGALVLTHWGRLWRAVADDPKMAALLGVDVTRLTTVSAVVGAVLAGVAGLLALASYGNASFYGGLVIGLKTLYVAVLGGLSSPLGAVAGAVLLGAFETFWSAYLPIVWRDAASFAALTFLLSLRPGGVGGREVERV